MKNILAIILSLLGTSLLLGQSNTKFQQEVNYKIEVVLDDISHQLRGNIEIEYHNNAPTALNEIWMHLWPNAYKNINTAFSKQKLHTGSTRFYFAQDSDFGYLDSLNFKVDGQVVTWDFDDAHIDIAKINLATPLKPGEKITIQTPFLLQIPTSFSRLGHVEQSYQLTQWFPKPAVFDHKGWHAMPYLDMGEFYSEFGNFEVKITLPSNYIVGATGALQTESEKVFLNKKIAETEAYLKNNISKKIIDDDIDPFFPPSESSLKTLIYTAKNVHDFAWFADKRFFVQKDEVTLKSGKKVDTWTMFTEKEIEYWKKSIEYVNQSVLFYSEMVGEYPWPQATALQSALSAGGGMEYPMITVIGETGSAKSLDEVITHEVGHNWFYGILASNERVHPWMDEGMNSYYEYRYMKKYYEGGNLAEKKFPAFFVKNTPLSFSEAIYLFPARRYKDQAPETHSDDFLDLNYGVSAYVKPAIALQHLEKYLGQENFDKAMQSYYQQWAFKHPYPEDFRASLEKATHKNLDWFFDGYINSTQKMDYAITNISQEENEFGLTIKNKGELNAPFPISGLKDDKIIETKWIEGFYDTQQISFPKGDYDKIILDAQHATLELHRTNNSIKPSGIFKRGEPLRVKFAPALENPRKADLFWLPAVGFNTIDKFMAGLALYNRTIPSKRLEFAVVPMYSFKTKEMVGLGDIAYNLYPNLNFVQQISIGIHAKRFNYDSRDSLKTVDRFANTTFSYEKFEPYLKLEFKTKPKSNFKHGIEWRSSRLKSTVDTNFENIDSSFVYTGNRVDTNWIHRLSYYAKKDNALNPFSFRFTLEQEKFNDAFNRNQNYIKTTFDFQTAYVYNVNRKVNVRFFLGYFLKNTAIKKGVSVINQAFYPSGQGFNDYRYDEIYSGRMETSGFWSQQVDLRDGGMKTAVGPPLSQIQGGSNRLMIALNLKADLPKKLPFNLPLRPYLDIVYSNEARSNMTDVSFADQVWASGGVTLEFLNGNFNVHFPIVNSNNINGLYNNSDRGIEQGKFFRDYPKRITFNINFQKLNPWKVMDESFGL